MQSKKMLRCLNCPLELEIMSVIYSLSTNIIVLYFQHSLSYNC